LCGEDADNSNCIFIKEGLFYNKCNQCGMVYISSPLKQEILEEAYESSEAMTLWLEVLKKQEDLDKDKFMYMLEQMNKKYQRPGAEWKDAVKLLDVGASYGYACHVAKAYFGWEPVGLELSQEAYKEYFNRWYQDFQMYKEKLEDYLEHHEIEEHFDMVTLWEVLEHIPNPSMMLEWAWGALKKNGLLGILVPNLNSKTARILHEEAKMFGANHLNYWNINTLTAQLKAAGFSVVYWETLIGDVNTWHNYLHFEEPYSGNLVHPDHEKATARVLEQGQGYKLFVVARKSESAGP
jgi:2-polyprenyl-3-methyl-5-hydroxy-6-metoxy-1,4-benzoquinol methylase